MYTYSVIIASMNRNQSLGIVLDCIEAQALKPKEVVIVLARGSEAFPVSKNLSFIVRVIESAFKSSAKQRNLGLQFVSGDVIAFLDDDIEFGEELAKDMLNIFQSAIGSQYLALAPRIKDGEIARTSFLLRLYYSIQAGFYDETFGGRVFGPGINIFPSFRNCPSDIVDTDWLPSTCLFIRRSVLQKYRFPEFEGYSFAEDVYLTCTIRKSGKIGFFKSQVIIHNSLTSIFKENRPKLVEEKLSNMAVLAKEVLEIGDFELFWKWNLHRLFLIVSLLLKRPGGWFGDLQGVFRARRQR